MACSTEKLLLLKTHQSYSDPLEKILYRQPLHHPPQKLPRFGPPLPSEVPLPSVGRGGGGGMDIFWNYTFLYFLLLYVTHAFLKV